MKNKTNKTPYPYFTLGGFLNYELEGLRNSYKYAKEKAFIYQHRYLKKKSQENRYKMNFHFLECSKMKHKIKQVDKWIKELENVQSLQKENQRFQEQIEKMKCCTNCKHYCINNEDEFDCCRSYDCAKFDKWELKE